MNNYHKALMHLMFFHPDKIPALYRMQRRIRKIVNKNYWRSDNMTDPPATIAIRITYKCTLRCIQCNFWGKEGIFAKGDKGFLDKELSTEEWKKFISEVARFKPHIYFTGGEPLLRKDLFELISFASSKGVVVRVGSNCYLLEAKAEELVKSGCALLIASIDGTREVNNNIRLGRNSFEKALSGIKALKEARIRNKSRLPMIRVQTVITEENYKYLFDMAKFVNDEIDADIWALHPGIFTTPSIYAASSKLYKKLFGIEEDKYAKGFIRDVSHIDIKCLEEQFEKIQKHKWKFKFYPLEPLGTKSFNFYKYFRHPEQFIGEVFCMSPFALTQIHPNGDVAVCSRFSNYIAGNILKDNFLDIWNNQKYRNFREVVKKGLFPSCTRCTPMYILLKHMGKEKDRFSLKPAFHPAAEIKND